MNNRILAPVVALALSLFFLLSAGTASAQNENRLQGYTITEVTCQFSDGSSDPTALPPYTILWIPDPLVKSEDGLSWWVGVASHTGGWTSMCWMDATHVAYGVPEEPSYYDGYSSDEGLPSDMSYGETTVNTEGIACEPNHWSSSEPTAYLPQGMWATKLASETVDGWQLVLTNGADGLLIKCYVEGIYLGEQMVVEPEQPEPVEEIESEPTVEPAPTEEQVVVELEPQLLVVEPVPIATLQVESEMHEEEVDTQEDALDESPVASVVATATPEPVTESNLGTTVTALPRTGAGDLGQIGLEGARLLAVVFGIPAVFLALCAIGAGRADDWLWERKKKQNRTLGST